MSTKGTLYYAKKPDAFYTQKREQILDAAQQIALEKPLPHVSMKDLIRYCGVSQGAIYHYFSSLDEIWLGLVERFYQADDILGHLRQIFMRQLAPGETACICSRHVQTPGLTPIWSSSFKAGRRRSCICLGWRKQRIKHKKEGC